jgi:hypothetical protein
MITPVIVFEVECDVCGSDFDLHADEPHWTAWLCERDLEAKLHASGWLRSRDGAVHVCSGCATGGVRVTDADGQVVDPMAKLAEHGGRVIVDPWGLGPQP